MKDKERDPVGLPDRNEENNSLERELDAALAKYSAVEPRAGLEDLILANLRAAQARVPDYGWWHWGVLAIAAAVIVVLVVMARPGRWRENDSAHFSSSTARSPKQPEAELVVRNAEIGTSKPATLRTQAVTKRSAHLQVVALPKLDEFPSRQPLSDQEKILASYVADYPLRAALLAEARMKVLRQDAEERAAIVRSQSD